MGEWLGKLMNTRQRAMEMKRESVSWNVRLGTIVPDSRSSTRLTATKPATFCFKRGISSINGPATRV